MTPTLRPAAPPHRPATLFAPPAGPLAAGRRAGRARSGRAPLLLLLLTLLLAGLLLGATGPVLASDDDDDHDRARAALQAGQVLPLRVVLERVAQTHPGEVLEVELEQDHGRWRYEIKLLQAGGQLRKLKVDARSGEVLQRPGRHGGSPDARAAGPAAAAVAEAASR